jgi:hypothetical protein
MNTRELYVLLNGLHSNPAIIGFIEEFIIDWLIQQEYLESNMSSLTQKGIDFLNKIDITTKIA